VVFNNLSLQYNSVGCYQLMKVLTTPFLALLQRVVHGVKLDVRLQLALVPICLGVVIATVSDIELTWTGLLYGVMGLISTSCYQMLVKSKQCELQLDSYQLLYYQAPLSAILVLFFVPVFDKVTGPLGLLSFPFSFGCAFWIIVTAVTAFLVNISIYLVIDATSPVSYNVLGHFKLCVILISGWLFFDEDMNLKKSIGTVMAFAGVIAYTHLKQTIANDWNTQRYRPVAQSETAGDTELLEETGTDSGTTASGVGVQLTAAADSGSGSGTTLKS